MVTMRLCRNRLLTMWPSCCSVIKATVRRDRSNTAMEKLLPRYEDVDWFASTALWSALLVQRLQPLNEERLKSGAFLCDSTGVQLWVHGVQRCHGPQCDSLVGDGGQVTSATGCASCRERWCNCVNLHVLCDTHPGCWVRSATRGRKPCCYAKSRRRKNHQDVVKKEKKRAGGVGDEQFVQNNLTWFFLQPCHNLVIIF